MIKKTLEGRIVSPLLLAIYDGDYYLICYERDQDDEIGTFNKIKLEEIDNVECLYDEELEGSTEFRFFDVEDIFTGKYLPNTERMNSAILAEYPDAELLAPKETVRLKLKITVLMKLLSDSERRELNFQSMMRNISFMRMKYIRILISTTTS